MYHAFLDLRRVRYIVAIAESGSISGASRMLNVAQPALSYHLNEMERALGASLFERSSTGVTPTVMGVLFIEHGKIILDAVKLAAEDANRLLELGRRQETIRLALIPSLAGAIVPKLIDAFRLRLPDRILHVIDARTSFANELIESGRADIAITLSGAADVDEPPLTWESLYCIMNGSEIAGPITFKEMASLPLILPAKGNPLRRFLEIASAKVDLTLNVIMDVDGFEPRKKIVVSGYGVTVFGELSVLPEQLVPDLVARRIIDPELRRPIILKSRSGLDPKLDRAIRDTLKDVFSHFRQSSSLDS